MNSFDLTRLQKTPTPGEIAGRASDPRFYAALTILPNPDPVLRKLGRAEDVYEAIQADAHVIGELRTIKAGFERFEHRLVPGGNDRKSRRALELCQTFLDRAPAAYFCWPDVFWNIGAAIFRGFSVHEIVWERAGDLWMPQRLEHRPNRRFAFGADGQPRVLTREQPFNGVPAEEANFLVMRHLPSYDNPYGVALFSSCYWPYTFKHAGFRWLVKFCERFGIPFPVGKYPAGTPDDQIKKLEEALEGLIEAGYAALQDDGAIELLEAKSAGGGKLAQHTLIELCNSEMSKALTSQTLATEQPNSGSRAAAETHRGRELDTNEGDREKIAFTLDHLWRLITRFNVGEDAKPPRSEFSRDEEVSKERAEVYEIFIRNAPGASRKAMAEELGIALADPNDPEDAIGMRAPAAPIPGEAAFARAQAASVEFPDQVALDQALDALTQQDQSAVMAPMLRPLLELARRNPDELLGKLAETWPDMDAEALTDYLTRLMFVADTWGRLAAQSEIEGGRA